MPIDIKCPKCNRKFRVADKFAGKRIKCPKCQGAIGISATDQPKAEEKTPPPRAVEKKPAKKAAAAEQWYMQTDDGEEFGPISREELDEWIAEGRINGACQVLQEGWDQWQWAEDVFPEIAESGEEEEAAEESPFDGISPPASSGEINPFESPQSSGSGIVTEPAAAQTTGEAVTAGSLRALRDTKPWVTFLAILGFVVGGLGALGALILLAVMTAAAGARGVVSGLAFLLGPSVSLLLSYYLFSYGQRIYVYLRSNQPRDLESALVAQKSFWKLAGIVVMVTLVLYLLFGLLIFVLLGQAATAIQSMPGGQPGF